MRLLLFFRGAESVLLAAGVATPPAQRDSRFLQNVVDESVRTARLGGQIADALTGRVARGELRGEPRTFGTGDAGAPRQRSGHGGPPVPKLGGGTVPAAHSSLDLPNVHIPPDSAVDAARISANSAEAGLFRGQRRVGPGQDPWSGN